jgi:multidrug efflux pump subunit AcrB
MIRNRQLLFFAGLILLVAAAGVFLGLLQTSFADGPAAARLQPIITVEAAYPGANAKVVAGSVAAPMQGR